MAKQDELVFLPLGGVGEIGMNSRFTAMDRRLNVNGSWWIAV